MNYIVMKYHSKLWIVVLLSWFLGRIIIKRRRNFRQIFLVGCVYKLLVKSLANRLKQIIDLIIMKSHMIFDKYLQILDDIFTANKIIGESKKKKKELIIFKVDLEWAIGLLIVDIWFNEEEI